ncbi:MAG: ASCH domain-containing protein [Paraburkholderia sp.]|uniref:ASCH domain-containing protein n=1 Tax=Paraburkholderia sp. TaxID=1926495 RepID=UPI00122A6966|nr:ASCH domain-containing protein [Paraburkholderia sp.]TAL98741.1 MAG: ASCH domain-containing protein [Paraburkholderia sp.]
MDRNVKKLIDGLTERGIHLPKRDVRVGGFGDSEVLATSLIDLIIAGVKHGTSSLLWSWKFDGEAVPKVGDIEIVLDWHGRPVLIRRATEVEIVPFDCVTADFAASEGEGDRSLSYWQKEHWRFFTEECKRIDRAAEKSMPVVCEKFEVLYTLTPKARNE